MTSSNVMTQTAPVAMSFAREVLPAIVASASAAAQVGLGMLRLPFDSARAQYAQGVHLGFIECSLLASRDFEVALAALEQLSLGPLVRRV